MSDIIVSSLRHNPQKGVLRLGHFRTPCALGRGGVTDNKREGDAKTPLGRFQLRRIWYRADRISLPPTGLPQVEISPKSGWCDDIRSDDYNRPIEKPFRFSHENLWRRDRLYDVIIELGQNDRPPIKGRGSAIFLHLEKVNFQPTLGCIALRRSAILHLLPRLKNGGFIDIRRG